MSLQLLMNSQKKHVPDPNNLSLRSTVADSYRSLICDGNPQMIAELPSRYGAIIESSITDGKRPLESISAFGPVKP